MNSDWTALCDASLFLRYRFFAHSFYLIKLHRELCRFILQGNHKEIMEHVPAFDGKATSRSKRKVTFPSRPQSNLSPKFFCNGRANGYNCSQWARPSSHKSTTAGRTVAIHSSFARRFSQKFMKINLFIRLICCMKYI